MPIVPGARFEHYEILAPLGAGGMSQSGRFILYSQLDPKTKSDVWALP